ncbi:MAG: Iron-sulfur flavoprotein [Methanocella sp. PtaU1.Bin125]|nr:MAG: Iron-sulfur flavoprotein [Methanocella sp. PtaU1.Bin125]
MTLRLVETALEGARQAGAEVEVVDLASLRIHDCKGCGACYKTGRCPQDDDFGYVMGRIAAADGVVLGSPAYFDSVTPRMMTLMDRMSDAIHCQRLRGRYGCSVCPAGTGGEGRVVGYMNGFLVACGASVTGGTGAALGSDPGAIDRAAEAAHAMGMDLAAAIREKRVYPDQADRHRAIMKWLRCRIVANKEPWAHDYFYWAQQGWLLSD